MNAGFLPACTAFGAVAAGIAVGYLALARLQAAGADWLAARRWAGPSMPGEAVRYALHRTDARLRRHQTAVLLALSIFGVLLVLGQRDWWPALSLRLWAVMALALLIPSVYGAAKLGQLLGYRAALRRLLALHREIAARLAEAQQRGNRVHYAVPAGGAVVDAVVTGSNGIYALFVVPPPPGSESVALASGCLEFGPVGTRVSLAPVVRAVAALTRDLAAGTAVRALVQPVLVVPGCTVVQGDDPRYLVVNLPACVSFVGWRNAAAFLMEDELLRADDWLAGRRMRPGIAGATLEATLGNAAPRPALV